MVAVLRRAPTAWLLGAFYFLTFGGFVAFSIYLPTLLRAQFGLAPADAGLPRRRLRRARHADAAGRRLAGGPHRRRAGPVVGVRRRRACFSLLLTWPSMVPFTVGALAARCCMGLGNGAVFKLVPEHFPRDTGTVTGLVGALGGLGGFFPPLLLGVFRDRLGRALAGIRAALADGARAARRQPARVPARPTSRGRVAAGRRRARRSIASAPARGPRSVTAALATAIVVGSRNLAAFRRRARRLHLRDAVCDVRHHLSLRDVAPAPADAHVLAARVAGVLLTRALLGGTLLELGAARRRRVRRQPLHLPARPAARRSPTG